MESRRLDFPLICLLTLFICPSYAHVLPAYVIRSWRRQDAQAIEPTAKNGANFARDFATAVGVAVATVMIVTALICAFAHCWRQILDWGRGDEWTVGRRRRPKDEEAWFCGRDRGLPMPRFSFLEPEAQPLAMSAQTPEPEFYGPYCGHDAPVAPAAYARSAVVGSQTRLNTLWNDSGVTLSSWIEAEDIERPASVAYLLDRP
ncbi:hypothetical protein F4802DRAFT_386106 [Xylaria palmicola]|nr:hypothetical protein F4802DRAFT_386106 [Xylaria palmicola]